MNKKEEQKIKEAIVYFNNDGWHNGMEILHELIGNDISKNEGVKLTIQDIMRSDYE